MSDLISRQAAIKAIEKNMHLDFICSLNVYKGHYTAGLQTAVTVVNNLPAAEPERKTGKWIKHRHAEEAGGMLIDNYECTSCHTWERKYSNFCPECGSYNGGT